MERSSTSVVIPGFEHEQMIDDCLVDTIKSMNEMNGLKTLGCCCGHGKYPESIIIETDEGIWEHNSGEDIPRTRRFYKTDAEGFYYIPEISTPK